MRKPTVDPLRYPALYAPKDGYVFVVTYGRSGSTLTQSLLNAIPGYCIRGENGNIPYFLARAAAITMTWDNYTWRREDKGKDKESQRWFLRDTIGTPSDPWFGAEDVDHHHFCRALMDVFARDILCITEGTRVSGFKEIRFHEDGKFFETYLDIIKNSFPKSKFIFQTRNAEAVSKSSWWGNRPKDEVMSMVNMADCLFKDFSNDNSQICYTINYEKYSEGYEYIREIYSFLGEEVKKHDVDLILNKSLSH